MVRDSVARAAVTNAPAAELASPSCRTRRLNGTLLYVLAYLAPTEYSIACLLRLN